MMSATYIAGYRIGMLVAGLGAGFMMAQGTTVTMMAVPPEQSGAASGLSETLKEIIGQGFAIALAGAILFGTVYSSMVDSFEEIEGLDRHPTLLFEDVHVVGQETTATCHQKLGRIANTLGTREESGQLANDGSGERTDFLLQHQWVDPDALDHLRDLIGFGLGLLVRRAAAEQGRPLDRRQPELGRRVGSGPARRQEPPPDQGHVGDPDHRDRQPDRGEVEHAVRFA